VRALRYPRGYPTLPPQEKGVDVKLAVDFVAMAIRGEYDVGILMSEDTDLKPAIEAVIELPDAHCEAATWDPPGAPRRGLRLPGRWCHYLSELDYRHTAVRPTSSMRDDADGSPYARRRGVIVRRSSFLALELAGRHQTWGRQAVPASELALRAAGGRAHLPTDWGAVTRQLGGRENRAGSGAAPSQVRPRQPQHLVPGAGR
jgi:hypothetical protein